MGMGELGHGLGIWVWWALIVAGVIWFLWMLPTFGRPREDDSLDGDEEVENGAR